MGRSEVWTSGNEVPNYFLIGRVLIAVALIAILFQSLRTLPL